MSGLVPLVWAFKVAPVAEKTEKLVLQALADAADEDGCNAYPSQSTIAERALCDERTVRRRLADLESRGLIARGDQRAAEHIPVDKRPVVWDVMIPYTAFGDGIESVNRFRKGRGRAPLTPENRPALPEPPAPRSRSDKRQRPDTESGGTQSPGGQKDRGDTGVEPGGHTVPSRGDTESDNLPPETFPSNHPHTAAADSRRSSTAGADGTSGTGAIGDEVDEKRQRRSHAEQIVRAFHGWYADTVGPVAGLQRIHHGARGLVEDALVHYTEDEIKRALFALKRPLPNKREWQDALVAVRRGKPVAAGSRPQARNVHHSGDEDERAKVTKAFGGR